MLPALVITSLLLPWLFVQMLYLAIMDFVLGHEWSTNHFVICINYNYLIVNFDGRIRRRIEERQG